MFPSLVHLACLDYTRWFDTPVIDEGFLTPLVGCTRLNKLEVCLHLKYTHAGLVGLCMSLPVLCRLAIIPCHNVPIAGVMAELLQQGRQVEVIEMRE